MDPGRSARALALSVSMAAALLCAGQARASSPWSYVADPVFVRVDVRGLPEAAVMALAQDSSGFLWIGTQGGLARYDGYTFRNFIPNPNDPASLPDGYIRTLLADRDGGIWIGASTAGLIHFDASTETFRTWHPDGARRTGPASALINALAVAPGGALWVGGDRGLDRYDPRADRFERQLLPKGRALPAVWSVLVDRKGTTWAGTDRGLYYRNGNAAFRRFPLRVQSGTPPVYSLYEDSGGRLWAGSNGALLSIDRGRRFNGMLTSSLAPGQQWSIVEMQPGTLWVGTDNAITIVDEATHRAHRVLDDRESPGALTGGRVLGFVRDRSGLMWIANHVGGLLLYNPMPRGLYALPSTRADVGFHTGGALGVAAARDGSLWLSGLDGAVTQINLYGASKRLRLADRTVAEALFASNDGTLWIGTTVGLCRLDYGSADPQCPAGPKQVAGSNVYAIAEYDRDLWVGGSSGLVVSRGGTGNLNVYRQGIGSRALSDNAVRALNVDRRGRLWIGTENGLDRLDPGGRIAHFVYAHDDPNSIGPGGVTSILEDEAERMWVGANGGPLNVLQEAADGTFSIRRIGLENGMPHENVDGLAEDGQGRIWAATDKGIAIIDPDSLNVRALGYIDGVFGGAYWSGSVTQAKDGTIFFGGLDGVTAIAPGAASPWNYEPPLVVTALVAGRHPLPVGDFNRGDSVDVPPGDRDVTVEFSALDYSAPDALRYAYKLSGYDRDWIDVDAAHRVATYTHLPPGWYTLQVRATNRLGVWGTHMLALHIHALPAWYESWLFRSYVLVFFGGLIYAFYTFRTSMLHGRQQELEALVAERTRELSQAIAKVEELSLSDPLTGLRNRRFLESNVESDIALALRSGADILFFLIDLDGFKEVNDEFGHNAGDIVLIEMRGRLNQVFRDSDFLIRWGGDEFLAIARGSHRDEACEIAERIRQSVNGRAFSAGSQYWAASVSIGFAAFPFVKGSPTAISWSQVLDVADRALYMAKRAGRNTWFGIESTDETDVTVLGRDLTISIEEAVRAGHLRVIHPEVVRGEREHVRVSPIT